MAKKDIQITCTGADIKPNTGYKVDVDLSGVDISDLLGHCTITDVIEHFGTNEIIKELDIEDIKQVCNLIENE